MTQSICVAGGRRREAREGRRVQARGGLQLCRPSSAFLWLEANFYRRTVSREPAATADRVPRSRSWEGEGGENKVKKGLCKIEGEVKRETSAVEQSGGKTQRELRWGWWVLLLFDLFRLHLHDGCWIPHSSQGMGHVEGEGAPKTLVEEYLEKVGSK